ncbi:MAG: hypothetical protein ABIH72_01500 [archaeon]
MRVLISKDSKLELFNFLKEKNNVFTKKELSKKLKISSSTLDKWFYNDYRYIPLNIVPEELKLKILDKKSDNWGKIKGGKKTYQILMKKYGINEIKKRQSKGGKNSLAIRNQKLRENLKIDINNPLFLEFYGALLGDGWLSSLSYNYKSKKNLWWVGISGHSKLDKEYLMFIKKIAEKLFNRKIIIKYKKNSQGMEILFSHKHLILFFNKELGFPVGKKFNLKINKKIPKEWDRIKYVIRGIFDTDGCLYFDKTPVGRPYPCLSIQMKAPVLIKQLYYLLTNNNFKVTYKICKNSKEGQSRITLKGSKQLNKWMNEIGSSNSKHFLKYKNWLNQVPVA